MTSREVILQPQLCSPVSKSTFGFLDRNVSVWYDGISKWKGGDENETE